MTTEEAKTMTKWIVGLFNGVTEEQAKHLRDDLLPRYDPFMATKVVKAYREANIWMSIPSFSKDLAQAEHKRQRDEHMKKNKPKAQTDYLPDERIIDYLRRTQPDAFTAFDDEDALSIHFIRCATVVMKGEFREDGTVILPCTDTLGIASVRKAIIADAMAAFVQIGKTNEEARRLAVECATAIPLTPVVPTVGNLPVGKL